MPARTAARPALEAAPRGRRHLAAAPAVTPEPRVPAEPAARLCRGSITRRDGDDCVSVVLASDGRRIRARLTLAAAGAARGDGALCDRADDGQWYVLGVVAARPRGAAAAEQGPRCRRAAEGTSGAREPAEGADPEAPALRLEQLPGSGRSVVYLPAGAVDFVAEGDLTWTTRGVLRLEALGGVELGAGQAPDGAPGAPASRLRLDGDRTELRTGRLEAAAEHVDVVVRRASVAADAIDVTAGVLRRAADLLETDAERILERAGASYHEVRDLAQTRAGRLRTVVEHTASTLAERFVLKTRADVRIDGERIHLG